MSFLAKTVQSIDVFTLPALDLSWFDIEKLLWYSPHRLRPTFPKWIQMQCHYYFSWEVFCKAIRNFGTEKGKYHSDQSRSTLAAGKQFRKIFQFTNILRAAKFVVTNFENDLQSIYFLQLSVSFLETNAHLGQAIYPSELSCSWCHSNIINDVDCRS